ncbi:LuxR C-terminal-related transcriptional regulator [Streptomyces sp. NPDC050560]|uniref:LuxR C-terminal-related transcriptional regulator n=1 Tax=Streptomyces sp. NPDC050560 TaxID=3365630 RepID=UPI003799542C
MPDHQEPHPAQNTPESTANQHVSQHASGNSAARSEHTPAPAPPPAPAEGHAAPLRVVVTDDNPVVRAGLTVLLSGRPDIEVVAEAADGDAAYRAALRHRPDVILLDVRMPGVDGISALPHLSRIAPVLMLTYSGEAEIVRAALRGGAGGYLVHGEFTVEELVGAVHDITAGRAPLTRTAAGTLLAALRGQTQDHGGRLPDALGTTPPPAVQTAPAHTGRPARPRRFLPRPSRSAVVRSKATPQQLGQDPSLSQSDMAQSTGRRDPAPGRAAGLSQREVEVMDLIASGMTNQQIAATCFISEKTVKNHINRIFAKLSAASRSEAIARWLGTAPEGGSGHA